MPVPRLHVVTNDEVLAGPAFHERAVRLLGAHGAAIAFHLRGPHTAAARLLEIADALAPAARDADAVLLVNDRADVALAVDAPGVQLGRRSLPVAAARALRPDWLIGASVHTLEEAADATGADFLVLGTIWETPSHPGRAGAGVALLRELCDRARVPVIAIGGVTPERAAEAWRAGAAGVAVVRGIWQAADTPDAAAAYLASMNERAGERA